LDLRIFFSHSAADLHWPDLHRIIEQQQSIRSGGEVVNIDDLTEQQAFNQRRANLADFPHLAASFLQARVKQFLEHLKKCSDFDYEDYWYRYEWQHRGSGHVHGFLWLKNGPKIDEKNLDSETHRQELVQFFKCLVISESPIHGLPPPVKNPCQLSSPVNKDNRTDIMELLNRCQRHTKCLESYCLRYNRTLK